MTPRIRFIVATLLSTTALAVQYAQAAERLCDSSIENCRVPLRDLIRNETQGIDVAFWFMEDSRYTTDLIAAHKRGVRVRVLVDTKANTNYPRNATMIGYLRDGGIPIRRITSSWLHWKMMLFAGQNVVQFGSPNYSPHGFVPTQPLVDFIDETIFFSDDPAIVNSFMTRFDEAWVSTTRFANYANISGPLARAYPVYPLSPAMNFPPFGDFGARAVARYRAETVGIDVIQFRLGDRRHADAVIAARQRGVPVRIYLEQGQYRDRKRPLSAYDTDRLYMAGVRIRVRNHRGWNHQKIALLHGQRVAIFGSQNWTNTAGQYEHNYFTTKTWIYQWLRDQFERKWSSTTDTKPFVPLPPTYPLNHSPASGAVITSSSQVVLRWNAGPFGQKYDIYFGTSSNPPLIAADVSLGHSRSSTDYKAYTVTVSPNRTYYWRIRSKTMANLGRNGPVWSFSTGAASGGGTLPSGWQSRDIGAVGLAGSASASGGTFTVRGAGADVWGSSDAFRYAYRSLSGDGTVTARVASLNGSQAWTKVGVMMRSSTSPGAAHAFMLASVGKGLAFQRRRSGGGLTTHTSGGSGTAPRWVRLSRSGSRITAYVSTAGSSWNLVGSDTFSLPSSVLVGVAVSSHTTSSLATGVFDNISISGTVASNALPSGWQARDIRSVGATGSASYSGGAFTVRGSGDDIWSTADTFQSAYRALSNDATIVARVASLVRSEPWTKVGVMIRDSTATNAAYAFMLVSKAKGLAFQRRTSTGASAVHTSGGIGSAPVGEDFDGPGARLPPTDPTTARIGHWSARIRFRWMQSRSSDWPSPAMQRGARRLVSSRGNHSVVHHRHERPGCSGHGDLRAVSWKPIPSDVSRSAFLARTISRLAASRTGNATPS